MEWLVTLLNFFGITPDKYPSLVLGIWILALALWQNSKINKMGASINATLAKIKSNIKVIVTFLATMYPEKFDTRLIEAMSPLRIKEGGYEILKESGFTAIMENKNHRSEILACIASQDPKSKLDVERYAIVYFPTLLEEDFLLPIKTYLYNFSKNREIFPMLAGLYIRDEYLKDHPEITQ